MERLIRATKIAALLSLVILVPLLTLPARGQVEQKKKADRSDQPGKKKVTKKMAATMEMAAPTLPGFGAQVGLPINKEIEQKIQAIPEYIAVKAWKDVTRALQEVLDHREDTFVPVKVEGVDVPRWVSARIEANRLLGTLPAEGREQYEVLSGGRAASLLKEARENNDYERLADVAQRYLHTKAGGEALDLLGTHHLDRGRYLMAALCFDRLLGRPETVAPASLFKAALASRRSDDNARADALWKQLEKQAPDGLTLGMRKASLDDLRKIFDAAVVRPASELAATDWLMFGGSPSRSAAAKAADMKQIDRAWQNNGVEGASGKGWLADAISRTVSRGQAVLPGFAPLSVGDKVLFRTQQGVRAVDAKTGELLWESVSLNNGLDSLADNLYPQVSSWIGTYLTSHPSVLVENSVIGTLSSDGRRVFVVEDVAVPPYPDRYTNVNVVRFGAVNPADTPGNSREPRHSRLVALNVESGKIDWVQGGITEGNDRQSLDDSIFLGPPLPLAGKLYALVEKDNDLRLVCLDPNRGDVVWSQPLITYKKTILQDPGRRLWSAPLAYADGILVCPSNSGAFVGVDLLTHSLVWAHSYVDQPAPAKVDPGVAKKFVSRTVRLAPPKLDATWKNAVPTIAGSKVLVPAPDAPALHCLNLRDGSLAWKVDRQPDDQYVAGVFEDKVLIVGYGRCRALSLKDGSQLWQTPTGIPAGQGVAAGKIYYLPLRTNVDGRAGIVGLELATGKMVSRIDMPQHDGPGNTSERDVPGNLVFVRGAILSQTPTHLTAYTPK